MPTFRLVSLIDFSLVHDQVQLTFRYYRKIGHLGHGGGHVSVVKISVAGRQIRNGTGTLLLVPGVWCRWYVSRRVCLGPNRSCNEEREQLSPRIAGRA